MPRRLCCSRAVDGLTEVYAIAALRCDARTSPIPRHVAAFERSACASCNTQVFQVSVYYFVGKVHLACSWVALTTSTGFPFLASKYPRHSFEAPSVLPPPRAVPLNKRPCVAQPPVELYAAFSRRRAAGPHVHQTRRMARVQAAAASRETL